MACYGWGKNDFNQILVRFERHFEMNCCNLEHSLPREIHDFDANLAEFGGFARVLLNQICRKFFRSSVRWLFGLFVGLACVFDGLMRDCDDLTGCFDSMV